MNARRAVGAGVVAAALAAPLLVDAAPVGAAFPGANGRIAYGISNDEGETYDVQTVMPDGSDVETLDTGFYDYGPKWTADGERLLFVRCDGPFGYCDIWTMNADGSDKTNITNTPGSNEGYASWSPSGDRIVYENYTDGQEDLWIMDADGSNQMRLTDDSASDIRPVWSPDGTRIAFASDLDQDPLYRMVTLIDPDGSNRESLGTLGWITDWSPDSSKMLLYAVGPTGISQVFVINRDGSGLAQLTTDDSNNIHGAWSPDGTKIAFVSDRNGDYQLFVMDPDGSDEVPLTAPDDGQVLNPNWQAVEPPPPPSSSSSSSSSTTTTAASRATTATPRFTG